MPHEPKRRHSTARKGKRRASISFSLFKSNACTNCGAMVLSHQVCKSCGYYNKKEIFAKKGKSQAKKAE